MGTKAQATYDVSKFKISNDFLGNSNTHKVHALLGGSDPSPGLILLPHPARASLCVRLPSGSLRLPVAKIRRLHE